MIESRYLTKMCDQVVALLSPEQSASLVWNEQEQESDAESVYTVVDDYDKLFAFEVSKTNEQEESATARPGFQVLFTVVACYRYLLLLTKKNYRR
jgi:sigma54-dependent transcription regulator